MLLPSSVPGDLVYAWVREKSRYSSGMGIFTITFKNSRHEFKTCYIAGKWVAKSGFKKWYYLVFSYATEEGLPTAKSAILAAHDEGFCNA